MAKASINIKSATPGANYNVIKFVFKVKAGYTIHSDTSIRLYYTPTEGATPTQYSSNITLDLTSNNLISMEYNSSDGYLVTYKINKSDINNYSLINAQLRMKIYGYSSDGTPYESKYASYKSITFPIEFKEYSPYQPLFKIAIYYNYHQVVDEDGTYYVWDKDWADFTGCIELPSYDVNYEDVNEDWEDANYFTHRIKVRSKITGKLDLRFSNIETYNQFLYLLKKSKERNGHGTAYVELMLQINDDIDEYSCATIGDINDMRCTLATGLFFVKMDSNPWVAPVFGHYDKYQAVSLSINEA